MSILIKSPKKGLGGGSSKGFPPEDINIISKSLVLNKLSIKYEDPEDTIYNNTAISTWAGTILVMKEGSYPTSPTDGTVLINSTTRNEYKDTAYTCTISSSTIYFRFYTYNTDKVYNDSSSMMFTLTNITADPILANNSWEIINQISEAGIASSYWSIGDEIDITLSGNYTIGLYRQTATFQIWDFNHFDKSDGSGKAGITFGCKNLLNGSFAMNSSDTNSGGWNASKMKTNIMSGALKSVPSDLQLFIKEVNTYANKGSSSGTQSTGLLSSDKIFLPGFTEVSNGLSWNTQVNSESNQKQFPIFTDNSSRIKKVSNNSSWWWTRSPDCYISDGFVVIDANGSFTYVNSSTKGNICICFNV